MKADPSQPRRPGGLVYADVLTVEFLRAAFADRRTLADIAAEVGCSLSAVRNYAIRLGVYGYHRSAVDGVRSIGPIPRWATDLTAEYLTETLAAGRSLREIAGDAGCSESTVRSALQWHRLPPPPPRRAVPRRDESISAEELRAAALAGKTIRTIAAEYGASIMKVKRLLHRYDIQTLRSPQRLAATLNKKFLTAAFRAGRTPAEVAAEVGCAANAVKRHARRHGVPYRHLLKRTPRVRYDVKALRAAVRARTPIRDIAAQHGVTPRTMRKILERHGLPHSYRPDFRHVLTAEFLTAAFRAGRTVQDVADEVGCSYFNVMHHALRRGVPRATREERIAAGRRQASRDPGRQWLRRAYIRQRRSMADIAAELGVGRWMVGKYLDKHGVPRRSRNERPNGRYTS